MKKLGRYEIIEEIGKGGMGTVYKAEQPTLNKIVALKVLADSCAKEEELVERFMREARIMAKLPDYSHVVEVFDLDEVDGKYFYTMEYIPLSLAEYIGDFEVDTDRTRRVKRESKVIPVETAIQITRHILKGLKVIHKAGIIHRDISPQNVMLVKRSEELTAKITDFGIAGIVESVLTQTGGGGWGKEMYAAPEQIESLKHTDKRSDIYSLGILMYRMFTGRLPIGRFKEPRDIREEISSGLNEVILRCMEQEPGDRFQSAEEMLGALEACVNVKVVERPKEPVKGSRIIVPSINYEMVCIKPGTFLMGRPTREGEWDLDNHAPIHRVTLTKDFYMGVTVVTQGQWYKVMGAKPWSGKKHVKEGDDYPAVYVSWEDCQQFITKLNQEEKTDKFRLPTEAEWEYACRAGSLTKYCFGDDDRLLADYAWYIKNVKLNLGERYPHPVAQKRPNAWGLYDMHGNVWEWCQDSCELQDLSTEHMWASHLVTDTYYDGIVDPLCSVGEERLARGGSWSSIDMCCTSTGNCAEDGARLPNGRYNDSGLRLARGA